MAAMWSIVNALTLVAFIVAFSFGMAPKNNVSEEYYYYNQENSGDKDDNDNDNQMDPELAVTSRALAFASMWTAVLAVLLSIFGTVILGWQSPTGQYYTCCSSQVHRTTPITLGGFVGALLMFANLTLICGAFFGEFEVRDYRQNEHDRNREGGEGGDDHEQELEFFAVRRKGLSIAFSMLCLFLAVMYGAFAVLLFSYSHKVLAELGSDETAEQIPDNNRGGGLGPLATPRLTSKSTGAHFVRPHEVVYHKHTHSAASLGGFTGPPNPTGTLA